MLTWHAIEHCGELINALVIIQATNVCPGTIQFDHLADMVVGIGKSSHLRQVGNADNLMVQRHRPEFLTDHLSSASTNANINLIEDQSGNFINPCEDGLECQ